MFTVICVNIAKIFYSWYCCTTVCNNYTRIAIFFWNVKTLNHTVFEISFQSQTAKNLDSLHNIFQNRKTHLYNTTLVLFSSSFQFDKKYSNISLSHRHVYLSGLDTISMWTWFQTTRKEISCLISRCLLYCLYQRFSTGEL